jgi:hypothetical protein
MTQLGHSRENCPSEFFILKGADLLHLDEVTMCPPCTCWQTGPLMQIGYVMI